MLFLHMISIFIRCLYPLFCCITHNNCYNCLPINIPRRDTLLYAALHHRCLVIRAGNEPSRRSLTNITSSFTVIVKLREGLFPALSAASHAPLPNCCRHTQEYDGANVCFFVMMLDIIASSLICLLCLAKIISKCDCFAEKLTLS